MKVTWHDSGREPKQSPNPAYPDGVDLDLSQGSSLNCRAELPYPAERCGFYTIECPTCGQVISCTTAGRRDDPRSITLACKVTKQ